MSWTAPQTWTTGAVPSTSQFNTDIRDNTNFLYSGMNTTGLSSTAKVLQTEYQNTTGRFRFVSAVVYIVSPASSGAMTLIGYVASTSPATNAITKMANLDNFYQTLYLFFPVPPGYYYSVSTAPTTAVLQTWVETTFHAT